MVLLRPGRERQIGAVCERDVEGWARKEFKGEIAKSSGGMQLGNSAKLLAQGETREPRFLLN